MSLRVMLRGRYGRKEKVTIRIAEILFEEFPEVVRVESMDSWDGANLRIVVSRDDPDLIERILERVYRIIDEHGELGNIIPEIVRADELAFSSEPKITVNPAVIDELRKILRRDFSVVIDVIPVDSWDGANLRIVVSRDDPDLIERILERVYRIIDEHGELGNIIPEISKVNTQNEV